MLHHLLEIDLMLFDNLTTTETVFTTAIFTAGQPNDYGAGGENGPLYKPSPLLPTRVLHFSPPFFQPFLTMVFKILGLF